MAHNKGKRRLGLKNGEFPQKDVSRETSFHEKHKKWTFNPSYWRLEWERRYN